RPLTALDECEDVARVERRGRATRKLADELARYGFAAIARLDGYFPLHRGTKPRAPFGFEHLAVELVAGERGLEVPGRARRTPGAQCQIHGPVRRGRHERSAARLIVAQRAQTR